MRRILPNQYHGVRQFRPENATEQAVVNDLQNKGYQVALFLAGRNVMIALQSTLALAPYRYNVQGPAYITRVNPQALPSAADLLDEGRRAMEYFQSAQGYNVQKDGWTVAVRPLRATNEACVQCHNSMGAHVEMNDALGAILYVYKKPASAPNLAPGT